MEYTKKDKNNMVQDFINTARNGSGNPEVRQSPEDQFIDNVANEENKSVIPAVDDEDARFLQNSLNMYNKVVANKSGNVAPSPLKIDGQIGPKSKEAVKSAYTSLSPAMRKMISQKMKKPLG